MIMYIYLFILFMIGYSFLYIHLSIIETQFIIYNIIRCHEILFAHTIPSHSAIFTVRVIFSLQVSCGEGSIDDNHNHSCSSSKIDCQHRILYLIALADD